MMQHRLPQFLSLTLGMVIYFTLSTSAEAGFIVATADTVSQNLFSVDEGSSTTSESPKTPVLPAYQETQADAAPMSGMSSPSSLTNVSSAGAAHAMLPTNLIDIPTLLITQLGPEGRVWLPPPFSTGVFRPPRFVV